MIEVIQIILATSMFSIATIADLQSRSVNDLIWLIFGSVGVIMTIIITVDNPNLIWNNLITTGICIIVSIIVWFMRCFGMADMFGIIVLSVILPQLYHIPLIPILVLNIAFILCFFYVIVSNIRYNLTDIFRVNLFQDIDESFVKKIFAFFLIHRRREDERFTFPSVQIVDGKKKFLFYHNLDTQCFTQKDIYVSPAVPMMPFFLISLFIILFFYILN